MPIFGECDRVIESECEVLIFVCCYGGNVMKEIRRREEDRKRAKNMEQPTSCSAERGKDELVLNLVIHFKMGGG